MTRRSDRHASDTAPRWSCASEIIRTRMPGVVQGVAAVLDDLLILEKRAIFAPRPCRVRGRHRSPPQPFRHGASPWPLAGNNPGYLHVWKEREMAIHGLNDNICQ